MIEIGIKDVKKYYGVNKIFENVSFELQTNEIIGLIGQNGTGKTTLMKILMGEEEFEGDVFLRKGIKLSYLDQIPIYQSNESTLDILYKAFTHIQTIKKKMTALELDMAKKIGNELNQVMNQYSHYQHEYETLGGYDIEENVSKIVTGLQLDYILDLSFNSLSGGEKTRVMLGKVLLENPDVLLLDEPTNHLDIEMVSWLEKYLTKYNGSVIIISHDRYFLDKVVTKIIELHASGIEIYHGNYSYYKIEKQRRYEEAMKEFLSQQKKIKNMEEQIKRYRIWGEMRDSDKMYRRAKELEKRLAKIDKLDKPNTDKNIKLNFEQDHRSGKRVYTLTDVSKSYGDNVLFQDLNLEVFYQDCLSIIGPNGCGKSTLLKIIREEIAPEQGNIHIGARLKVGYLPQEIVFEDDTLTILETYQNYFNCTIGEARSALARVLFQKNDVFKKVSVLSGGEKIRLKLVMLMDKKVNVLLLDEPTNHLDIESRETLESSLLSFNGTVIAISHDRYFINKFSNKIAEINDKKLTLYYGDFENYLEEKQKETDKLNKEFLKKGSGKKKQEKVKEKNVSIEKEIEDIQFSIQTNETELLSLIEEMNLYGEDLEYLQKLYTKKEDLEKIIESLYEKLETLL